MSKIFSSFIFVVLMLGCAAHREKCNTKCPHTQASAQHSPRPFTSKQKPKAVSPAPKSTETTTQSESTETLKSMETVPASDSEIKQ